MRWGLVGLAASVMVAATVGFAPAAHAASATSAESMTVRCTDFALDVHVQADGAVTGTDHVSDCTSSEDPDLHRATIVISGEVVVVTADVVVTDTTDTITWNTGQTGTDSEERVFVGADTVAEHGAGTSQSETEVEDGTGTRIDRGVQPAFTGGHAGESLNLIVHAVVGGIPFEIINSPFEG